MSTLPNDHTENGVPRRSFLAGTVSLAGASLITVPTTARAAEKPAVVGKGAEAKNLVLVGTNDLQARSTYQPLIEFNPIAKRWIFYGGEHAGHALNPLTGKQEANGTSIVDVTDPRKPTYLAHIPGPGGPDSSAQMVRVANGSDLPKGDPKKVYLLRATGGDAAEQNAHEIWDVTDPRKPEQVTTIVSGLTDTHKSWWEAETGIAYLVSGVPGWRVTRMTQVYDLSDPEHPRFIRNFGLDGQQPGSSGPIPTEVHGMISVPSVNRIYFGYGTADNGYMQIVDREKLLTGASDPTPQNLQFPQVSLHKMSSLNGDHTTFPVLGMTAAEFTAWPDGGRRDIVAITGEEEGNQATSGHPQMLWFADITDETTPQIVSNYHVDERSGGFASRGGRFGSHATNENMTPIYYRKVVFVSYFVAGVRAVDIRDPYSPKEAGFYIPAVTRNTTPSCITVNGRQQCKRAIQTNNVEVDDRGYVYIVDRANTGLHILRPTGELARIVGL